MTSKTLVVEPAAKLNLCLHVLGRRADGYHELAMAMQRITLWDRLEISVESGRGISLSTAGGELDCDENIVVRAARLYLETSGIDRRVRLLLQKNIPIAAGLGGGSADAAAVLEALNRLCDHRLSPERLARLAAQLGADVPFFLFKDPAWATGIGTHLEPLSPLPEVWYLLLNPGFAVSTAWVYQSLQLTKGGELANLPRFSVKTVAELVDSLHNDLERITAARYPEIGQMKKFLLEQGAEGALMSGSGASVFGIFLSEAQACAAQRALPPTSSWRSFVVRPCAPAAPGA
ncbi:MAG: 4-(cytidine 5'-diphospho)-2-C-methyl-D-erythritol kinase [Deltaproteobacteria bacterium]|nr:4-(cytidine 5'-diphospho)-2-C-methyl-D-erythritol kinase [Deltaproteobacteria bacterium]